MRLRHNIHQAKRAGLTLVEMLIALALSIFIMAILSEAFVKGLEVFGQYKALADLEQRLRTVANIVRRDLRAQHFDGGKKLSELTESGKPMPMLDGLRPLPYNADEARILLRQLQQYRFKSPSEGFFSVEEWPNRPGAPPRIFSFFEGQDSSGRPSYRDQFDVLHFTSRLEGNEPDKFFYGKVRQATWLNSSGLPIPLDLAGQINTPPISAKSTRYDQATFNGGTGVFTGNGLYTSQAAEILMFVGPDDTAILPGVGTLNGPILTFNLYRQAWLLRPSQFSDGSNVALSDNYTANPVLYPIENDVSAANFGGNYFYNTMGDVQHRTRRINSQAPRSPKYRSTALDLEGSDILLTNVISFDVRVFDPFAYKIPLGIPGGGPASGRGTYVDIGDVSSFGGTYPPTAASVPGDELRPVYGNTVDTLPFIPPGFLDAGVFDTGTSRYEGTPGGTTLRREDSPFSHPFPFPSIQITIRVYEPKSRQTRQITIIQDM